METKKMYANLIDYGEDGCFGISLFCDGVKGSVAFWSDGTDISPDCDKPEDYSAELDEYVYWHANFSRLIKLCRRVLRRCPHGYADEVPVAFCFR